MKRKLQFFFLFMTVMVSLSGNEVKVVQPFEQIEESSVSLARSEWKKYLNRDAKVPMEYSIFRVRINGNTDAVKKAKSSFKLDLGSQLMVKDTYTGDANEIWFLVPAKAKLVYLICGDGCKECLIWDKQIIPDKVYYGEVSFVLDGEDAVTQQFLVVKAMPQFSLIEIDGEIVKVTDGAAMKYVSFGRHRYRVSAKDYHAKEGVVDVNDAENKVEVKVVLDPAYGWIDITGGSDIQGADVYINDKMVGTAPMKTEAMASGEYDVRIVKTMYKPYKQIVTVRDNQMTEVKAVLEADFAMVTLRTSDDNAEIWVNGEKKGAGQWIGRLERGEYLFETKRENHKTQVLRRKISAADGGVIELAAPTPICGRVLVQTEPVDADIFLDGVKVGTTPMMIQKVLIGNHEIVISKAGCAERRERVTVTEGQTTTIDGRLAEGNDVRLSCGVPAARWTVDGVDRGTGAEITVNLSYAEHSVVIKAEEYVDFSERFTVGTGTTYKSFAIQRIDRDVETITVKGVTFRMRRVEGGTFRMGSESGDSDEKPVHSVTLSDYYIGETEVTQALWVAVMGSNPSYFKGDNLPVEQVSWNDCQEFIRKLNQMTGRRFALPTDAQREFAARGGNKSRGYEYSGSNSIGDVAWYQDNSSNQAHPVGSKQANELGLYDMSGNVMEWCQDWYGSYSSSSQTDPTGPSTGSYRVLRGGSWRYGARNCLSFCRCYDFSGYRYGDIGFRLVLLF